MSQNSVFQTDTFTAAANGTTFDTSHAPLQTFGIQVAGTGATPTSWTVVVEGSIDGTSFTTIATHTNLIGVNVALWTGSSYYPCRYFRNRCVAIVLGTATNIVVTTVGMQ